MSIKLSSYRQHVVGSCFLSHSQSLSFGVIVLVHFNLGAFYFSFLPYYTCYNLQCNVGMMKVEDTLVLLLILWRKQSFQRQMFFFAWYWVFLSFKNILFFFSGVEVFESCFVRWTRVVFALEQRSAHHDPWATSGPPPVFVVVCKLKMVFPFLNG